MIKCKILTHTPNPEEVVTAAGKLCYSAVGVDEILEKQTPETIEKFVNMLMSMGHESPIEHVSFTFAVEGVSRSLTHQLVRHRLASYSQQSQRYVKLEDTFEYITPKEIEKYDYINSIFIKSMNDAFEAYVKISRELLIQYSYEYLIDEIEAYCPDIQQDEEFMLKVMREEHKRKYSKFEKKAIENARAVLPNACETKIVFTMNARTLMNFFSHRCCRRSQGEINELAHVMLKLVQEIAPILFKYAGAGCVRGKCPEGMMTCGIPYKRIK